MPDIIDLMGDYQTSWYPDMSEVIPCEYYTELLQRTGSGKRRRCLL
ncbi:hypothetical protein [Methanospirillum sp.]|nr:hypothetical protein [Methanospirillum sp.]